LKGEEVPIFPVPIRARNILAIIDHAGEGGSNRGHGMAKTRAGRPCMSPAVAGKNRCRMHGGAAGSGAPKGNQNALKSGLYTKQAIEQRKQVRALIKDARKFLSEID
jgi:hypothetical protein